MSFVRNLCKRLWFFGASRYCNLCGRRMRRFLAAGVRRRSDAQCPFCFSMERHRLMLSFLMQKTDFFDGPPGRKMLHVAPEEAFRDRFSDVIGDGYLTADLMDPDVMEKMDVTDIAHPDESFDIICCSHVLEHVPNDRRAMQELCRVLRPTGWAILNVPITADQTVEDPSVTDPAERERLFGQRDHVRRYGRDYVDRLEDAGFVVQTFAASDLLSDNECERMALNGADAGEMYFCRKAEHGES